jgi:hypothetical protein
MYKKKTFYFSSLLGDFCQGAFVLFPCNMFTEEDMDNLPDLGISPTEGAQNLLQHLKPNKATGLDDIPAKFLKEVSIEISPLISIIRSRTNSI